MVAMRKVAHRHTVEFKGVGGPKMQQAGLTSLFPMDDLAVMGIAEVISSIFRIKRRISETVAALLDFHPHIVVTIDSKGFCHRVLTSAREEFVTAAVAPPACIQYVAPSIWAYKDGGPQQLAAKWGPVIDHMLCILPFEPPLCRAASIPATFVGHPVLEDAWECQSSSVGHPWEIHGDGAAFRLQHGLGHEARPMVCFLPGSRRQEIQRLLPTFRRTFMLLREGRPKLTAVVVTIPGPVGDQVTADVAAWSISHAVTCTPATEQERYNAFAACDVAIAASGTAVMQLLLARIPTVVAYQAHWLTEWVARRLAAVRHLALPNILAGREVVPEAIFADCTPERLAQHASSLLKSRFERTLQAENAERILSFLGPPASRSPGPCKQKRIQRSGAADSSRDMLTEEDKVIETGVAECPITLYERPSMVAARAILHCFEQKHYAEVL
ncbi:lipid-A-disaccharide synthase [Klebsormidium nitens]|uniref:lipid-A-disaccharide synthase n=1 Tax=Klebsormidium nitens TaxID=105231 RepID=A0A1Y1I098_KLENI|nr:lipid-A-disaccharide synthase [Klebsormidium nitens]|eukprot:GAQ84360.1 lipid-A-disaccharide synthase [Klebsormidium nitens]